MSIHVYQSREDVILMRKAMTDPDCRAIFFGDFDGAVEAAESYETIYVHRGHYYTKGGYSGCKAIVGDSAKDTILEMRNYMIDVKMLLDIQLIRKNEAR